MKTEFEYRRVRGDERLIETPFFIKVIENYCEDKHFRPELLDVGGQNSGFVKDVEDKVYYHCCDLVCGDFTGNFLTYDFTCRTFNIITGLSSIEHFGAEREDFDTFKKIGELLTPKGIFIVSLPMGKPDYNPHIFMGFRQYDYDRIYNMMTEAKLTVHEERFFKFVDTCFEEVEYKDLVGTEYRGDNAPNGNGMYLAVLGRE